MASTDFRLTGLDTRGADLTLSALELHGIGGRLDVGAVITSSHAPIAGNLSALGDGDALTSCTFAAADVASPGFWIGIQVSAAQEVTAVAVQGLAYALTLCELLAGGWSLVMSIQDTRGLPSMVAPVAVEILPLAAGDLTVFGGISGAYATKPVVSEVGVKFGSSGTGAVPAFARLTASPAVPWVGMRAKLVFRLTRDSAARKHGGFFFPDGSGSAGGYRVVFLDETLVFSTYQGGWEINPDTAPRVPAPGPLVGEVVTLEVTVGPGGQMTAYKNGHLLGTFSGGDVRFQCVFAGVFVYDGDIEVRRVELSSRLSLSGPAAPGVVRAVALPHPLAPLPQGLAVLRQADALRAYDLECGGQGCIYGTVELYAQAGNIPLPRRVRLHRSRDGLLVRETWSDAQGHYRFDGITDRYKYDVIAWDHEGLQQSVVANDLTPEVMP